VEIRSLTGKGERKGGREGRGQKRKEKRKMKLKKSEERRRKEEKGKGGMEQSLRWTKGEGK